MHRFRLARLPAGDTARTTLWLPCPRPYEPEAGLRFNPAKVLIDPYAKAIAGNIDWSDALFGYRIGDPKADLSLDDRDNAGFDTQMCRRRPGVHLGRRPTIAYGVGSDGDL